MKKIKLSLGFTLFLLLLGAGLNNAAGQFPSSPFAISFTQIEHETTPFDVAYTYHATEKATGIESTYTIPNLNLVYYTPKSYFNTHDRVDEIEVSFDFENGKELMPYVKRILQVNNSSTIHLGGMQVADIIVDKGEFTDGDGKAVYTYLTDMGELLLKYPNLTAVHYEIWLNGEMANPENPNGEGNGYPGILRPYTLLLADGLTTDIATQGYTPSSRKMTFQVEGTPGKTLAVTVTPALPNGLKATGKETAEAGVYDVVIPIVNAAIEINVAYDTSAESGEVGNADIASDAVWGAGGVLHVNAAVPGMLSVYSIAGLLVKREIVSGVRTFALPKGIYIVKLNGLTIKVLL
ncbi:MAG: hypothetical protein LBE91_01275 [Tannerella sp.]|jgi:hypothetical protein|nr:hypothetical protein [Tannerella sp.]